MKNFKLFIGLLLFICFVILCLMLLHYFEVLGQELTFKEKGNLKTDNL